MKLTKKQSRYLEKKRSDSFEAGWEAGLGCGLLIGTIIFGTIITIGGIALIHCWWYQNA